MEKQSTNDRTKKGTGAYSNITIKKETATRLDKPGKLTHLRRMKLTRVNELPRFDLSLG